MTTARIRAVAIVTVAVLGTGGGAAVAEAQGRGLRRIALQRHELIAPDGKSSRYRRVRRRRGVRPPLAPGEESSTSWKVRCSTPSMGSRRDHEAGGVCSSHRAIHAARTSAAARAEPHLHLETGKPLVVMAAPSAGAATRRHSPFRVDVPAADLADLQRRLAATRWPDRETVNDRSQGAPLALLQDLVRHWGTGYDWRKAEAKLNAHPQFMTRIDGVDIHFIHVRSRHPNAMPVLISHGWPGSVFEQIKLIGPLTDPTRFGGRAEDAFDVVIPSLPGYGFSGRPIEAGWGLERIGQSFDGS